jgi:type IV pilus assembly protein PilA
MLARIRKAQEEREGGFTLIELLVVMIIIGILAAIAIPVFLSQRAKAQDSAAKADVSTIGKELATYYVDNLGVPTIALTSGGRYTLTSPAAGATAQDIGKASTNVTITSPATSIVDATHWCVGVTNSAGAQQTFKYSAKGGLDKGACVSGTDY